VLAVKRTGMAVYLHIDQILCLCFSIMFGNAPTSLHSTYMLDPT
jgi:hypothetical protein